MLLNSGFIAKNKDMKPFIIEIEMKNPGTYRLGLIDNHLHINWGDGQEEKTKANQPGHEYLQAGTYTITCSGTSSRMYFYNQAELRSIKQWGTSRWEKTEFAFSQCNNLHIAANDAPDLSKVKTMRGMFAHSAFTSNGNLSLWEVSKVRHMGILFFYALNFNDDISRWNVGNVNNFDRTFLGAKAFKQDISKWDFSRATYLFSLMRHVPFPLENYDKLLIALEKTAREYPGIYLANPDKTKFFEVQAHYCKGEAARESLIQNYGFAIEDKGKKCP